MRDRMDDHLIQEPRIRRVVRRQLARPAPVPHRDDQPRVPSPRGPAREEPPPD